jgi:hypothetical protein
LNQNLGRALVEESAGAELIADIHSGAGGNQNKILKLESQNPKQLSKTSEIPETASLNTVRT